MGRAKGLLIALGAVVAAFFVTRRNAPVIAPAQIDTGSEYDGAELVYTSDTGEDFQEVQQADPAFDFTLLSQNIGEFLYNSTSTDTVNTDMASKNEIAFLKVIRFAEGTAGPNGYRTLFGGGLFDNGFVDHPRIAKQFKNGAGQLLWTSAAGAYQFMAASPLPGGNSTKVDTWGTVKRRAGLPDFSPASQDAAALYLIDEAGALADVRAGRFTTAINKVRKIWASLPGAGYSQPEKSMESLSAVYQQSGGAFA